MRGTIAIFGIGFLAAGTALGQGTPTPSSPTSRGNVASPAPGRARGEAKRPSVYVTKARGHRPVATGLDGLDVPIDRRAYGGTPDQWGRSRIANGLVGGAASAPGSALNPPGAPTSGSRYLITSGAISANNAPGTPGGQSVYTFTNDQGGTSAILYDTAAGGATRYDYIGSVGHVYYGNLPPGVRQDNAQVPTLTFGNGFNSLSSPGGSFTADSVGPFGAAHFPTPPVSGINPVSPSYTGTVGGISLDLQAPSLGGTP